MDRYVAWYVTLPRHYRIAFSIAATVGVVVALTGVATANILFFVLGGLWIVASALLAGMATPGNR